MRTPPFLVDHFICFLMGNLLIGGTNAKRAPSTYSFSKKKAECAHIYGRYEILKTAITYAILAIRLLFVSFTSCYKPTRIKWLLLRRISRCPFSFLYINFTLSTIFVSREFYIGGHILLTKYCAEGMSRCDELSTLFIGRTRIFQPRRCSFKSIL